MTKQWSYSKWNDYDICPSRFKYKYFDKLSDGGDDLTVVHFGADGTNEGDDEAKWCLEAFGEFASDRPKVFIPDERLSAFVAVEGFPVMARGTYIHKLAENYLKGMIRELPKELHKFSVQFLLLRDAAARGEATWTFDENYEPCELFAREAYVRVKTDAHVLNVESGVMRVIDYKTGRIKPYNEQKELYAFAAFARFGTDQVKAVQVELWFLDHGGPPSKETFAAWQLGDLRKTWNKRVAKMQADERFDPRPSNFCNWCTYSKSKGGPCAY